MHDKKERFSVFRKSEKINVITGSTQPDRRRKMPVLRISVDRSAERNTKEDALIRWFVPRVDRASSSEYGSCGETQLVIDTPVH